MAITIYDEINNMWDTGFTAGTYKELVFTLYAENGIDALTPVSATWAICPYGEYSQTTLQKTGSINTNEITVTLNGSDTLSLSGKYIQQLVIEDSAGHIFRPGQGCIVIMPAIQS